MNTNEVAANNAKAYKGMAMEGFVATWYAKNTAKDINRHQGMAARMSKLLAPGACVLEVAPGPGFFSIELAKMGEYKITGLDISNSFVEIARKNAAAAGVSVDFRQGNASAMPFAANTFDFLFCQAAFKNFTQPVQAIAEMHRVLRPHGLAVILDLRRDATLDDINRYVKTMGVNRVNEWMTRLTFRQFLLKNAHSEGEMETMVAQTPFGVCRTEHGDDHISLEVWLQKQA